MTSKTITICGKKIEVFYCSATENGYERMSGKLINVFLPTFKKDEHGEAVIDKLPEATTEDYLYLAMAGIMAADTYHEREESTITSKEILYDATPTERKLIIDTIVELRSEWYEVPKIIKEITEKENAKAEEPAKN